MATDLVDKGFEWHPSTAPAMSMPLTLACVRCIVVFSRLHGVRDAHGADWPCGAGGMGSGAQARRARGARGRRLGVHAAAGRGRSQPDGHAHQPIDPGAKSVGTRPYRCLLKKECRELVQVKTNERFYQTLPCQYNTPHMHMKQIAQDPTNKTQPNTQKSHINIKLYTADSTQQATQPRTLIALSCSSSNTQAVNQPRRLASKQPSTAPDPIRTSFLIRTKK